MKKIHIIHTGGTIGSERKSDGTIDLFDVSLESRATDGCICSSSSPFNVLSENMSPKYWTILLNHIKSLDLSDIDALFITHGTDTLAYTTNIFSLLLNNLHIPVFFISSNSPLTDSSSNGYDNFSKAMDMVMSDGEALTPNDLPRNNTLKGVFVPYKNSNGEMIVHKGENLLQSATFSDDFFSVNYSYSSADNADNAGDINNVEAILKTLEEHTNTSHFVDNISKLDAKILVIKPHPGISYNAFNPNEFDAILHETYHSFTATDTKDGGGSLIEFASRMDSNEKRIYLAPISSSLDKNYTTISHLLESKNIIPLYDMSFEMAYGYLTLLNSF